MNAATLAEIVTYLTQKGVCGIEIKEAGYKKMFVLSFLYQEDDE